MWREGQQLRGHGGDTVSIVVAAADEGGGGGRASMRQSASRTVCVIVAELPRQEHEALLRLTDKIRGTNARHAFVQLTSKAH
mmetsp:Transcript_146983/g.471878  ORF Transcript_146983/g.471878 Transcript_146983/m.471878 type:complete len:82 (-) Transcript_146983:166-411(-)